jgi:S1-C subfamily serine protease
LLAIAGLAASVSFLLAEPPEKTKPAPTTLALKDVKLPASAAVLADPAQVVRSVYALGPGAAARRSTWKPAVNAERGRGPALKIYSAVAPRVVVVRTETGSGTGFIVDPAGWIVTNHHVIADALADPDVGAQVATVYLGSVTDGVMHLRDKGIPAVVYKASEDKDLALLKLTSVPSDLAPLTAIPLAEKVPPPGSDCVAIGHPKAGMLWTVRSCEVAGTGTWPQEMLDVVMQRLRLTGSDREQLLRAIASAPKRKVVLSSCGVNPGDSGGPLVDEAGNLIAVTFAIPRGEEETAKGISLDKFAYHVHVDEVRAFLADRPDKPVLAAPNPWPAAPIGGSGDVDKDGVPETLMYGNARADQMNAFMVDLDQNSASALTEEIVADPAKRGAWDFEFVFQLAPLPRAFYDTDDDGNIDLILTSVDGNPTAESVLRLKNGKWVAEKALGLALLDPSYMQNTSMARRLEKILKVFMKG